jgi:hypothetical protein
MTAVQDNLERPSAARRLAGHLRHNIVGYIALFVALDGAVATTKLGENSVTTDKIPDEAITQSKIADAARGFTKIVVRKATTPAVPGNTVGVVTVTCEAGEVATGGGGLLSNSFTAPAYVRSHPSEANSEAEAADGETPQAWTTRIVNTSANANDLDGYVICASK